MWPYHSLYCNAYVGFLLSFRKQASHSHLVSFPFYSSQETVQGSVKARSVSIVHWAIPRRLTVRTSVWTLVLPIVCLTSHYSSASSKYPAFQVWQTSDSARMCPWCFVYACSEPVSSVRCNFWSTIFQGSTHTSYPWETLSDTFRQLCVLSFVVPHTSIRSFLAFWIFQILFFISSDWFMIGVWRKGFYESHVVSVVTCILGREHLWISSISSMDFIGFSKSGGKEVYGLENQIITALMALCLVYVRNLCNTLFRCSLLRCSIMFNELSRLEHLQ